MKTAYLYAAVFFLLSTAAFLLLRLDSTVSEAIRTSAQKQSKIRSFQSQSKLGKAAGRLLIKGRHLLEVSKIPLPLYAAMTVFGAVGGYFAGRLVYRSTVISLATGVIGMIVPLLVLGFQQTNAGTVHVQRLASSMMILSNSYLSTEDIIQSVRENLANLDAPEPFRDFLTYVTLMDSDVQYGLRRMEKQVDNPYFSQWIDALCMAQSDRELKYVCVSVVDSLHDVIAAQQESDAAMFAVWRDYLITLILIFSVPLVFQFAMPEAYTIMTTSVIGQGLFVLLLAAVIYSVVRALKINTPILQ